MKNNFLSSTIILVLTSLLISVSVTAQDAPELLGETGKKAVSPKGRTHQNIPISPGAVFTVNDEGDGTDAAPGNGICETSAGNGICTLRAAVAEANALAGLDSIIFSSSVAAINVAGQIQISSDMHIIGNGADVLTITNTAAAATTSRIFNISNFAVTLSGMTITGGDLSSGNGGGINNIGNLTISDCVITQNTTTDIGGGIRSTNTLTLLNSSIIDNSSTDSTSGGLSFSGSTLNIINTTIDSNTSVGNGGGTNISASSSVLIMGSTISNNISGESSGGFFLNRGTIINTTISGNQANGAAATDGGGGVRIQSGANTVEIISSTITGNTAPNGGDGTRNGIWHETGSVTLTNTIVAENGMQDIVSSGGTMTSNGFNLIGINTGVETQFPAGLPSGTDYVGTAASPLSPMLAPLADNGGPTMTHLPLDGSPAIDKGSAAELAVDQRGFHRSVDIATPNTPTGDGTDIGSVETLSVPAGAGVTVSGTVTDSSGILVNKATVTISGTVQRTTRTSSFGHFRFENVPINEAYILTVRAKSLQFDPVVIATSDDDIEGLIISANP